MQEVNNDRKYAPDDEVNIQMISIQKQAQYSNSYNVPTSATQPINNVQVGYTPNQMNNQSAFAACNQGIAKGFGPMFFNMRDPVLNHSNVPIKQDSQVHGITIFGTCLLIGGLVTGILGLRIGFFPLAASIVVIVLPYLVYLFLTLCGGELVQYIKNMKRFEDYKVTYQKMINGQGSFNFHIVCYHYIQTGKTSRSKVVTHTANEAYPVRACFDQSGGITSIHEQSSYVFIHYLKRYYFTDDTSQNKFVAAYNNFVSRNTRDCYQDHSHTFQINGYEQFVSFSAEGQNTKSMATFYIFSILGLALPYSLIFERSVSRYEVGILKRITL